MILNKFTVQNRSHHSAVWSLRFRIPSTVNYVIYILKISSYSFVQFIYLCYPTAWYVNLQERNFDAQSWLFLK